MAMRVVHLCTSDSGGAGKAAHRLHQSLQVIGLSSSMLVLNKDSKDPSVFSLTPDYQPSPIWISESARWEQRLQVYPNRPKGLELFSDARSGVRLNPCRQLHDADVIHFHWIDGMIDFNHVAELFPNKPIVWTLHDMNAFTGGCHYSLGCPRYTTQCGACPQLGSSDENDFSREVWMDKHGVYPRLNLHPVTPSRWLAERARESRLLSSHEVRVIPNGIPLDLYQPGDKNELRTRFNTPQDVKLVLFGAAHDTDRKGYRYFLEAMQQLRCDSKLILLTFGTVPAEHTTPLPHPLINLGNVAEEPRLAMIYALADVFVIPSLEDNLPNTVIESLACGTPVAGFRTGGIPDMVEDRVHGALAEPRDVQGLVDSILWCLNHPQPAELRRACRSKAESFYSLEKQAHAFRDLYSEILSKHSSNSRISL